MLTSAAAIPTLVAIAARGDRTRTIICALVSAFNRKSTPVRSLTSLQVALFALGSPYPVARFTSKVRSMRIRPRTSSAIVDRP